MQNNEQSFLEPPAFQNPASHPSFAYEVQNNYNQQWYTKPLPQIKKNNKSKNFEPIKKYIPLIITIVIILSFCLFILLSFFSSEEIPDFISDHIKSKYQIKDFHVLDKNIDGHNYIYLVKDHKKQLILVKSFKNNIIYSTNVICNNEKDFTSCVKWR